ncbi:MAG: ClpXP protease specificity-enhancing factor [Gammaproteobacteria bacterium]|nr:ClpXP protease specificity-enhancing factor [Gammaproteobacteria bacterium]
MTSSRPYLIRALYEWIMDNEYTPYILVNTGVDGVEVPSAHIKDEQLTLNINPLAVQNLSMGNEFISFSARFSGKTTDIFLPIASILAVYAQENGKGMVFSIEENENPVPPEPGPDASKKPGKPQLTVVK